MKKFNLSKEGITLMVASITLFFGIIFWREIGTWLSGPEKEKGKTKMKKEKKEKEVAKEELLPGITVLETWELPRELTEVSGIAFMDKGRFACVQDEKGSVYIFNSADNKIEKEIGFSGPGDYEGISVVGKTIYVMRADGKLFVITDMNDANPVIEEINTGLSIKNNVESLCYDPLKKRLLMTGKEKDPQDPEQKIIYSFDILSKKMDATPAFTIDLNHALISSGKKGLQPSAININPVSRDIYIVDGPSGKLLIMDPAGEVKQILSLDSRQFPQAEGISFSANGDTYISTEGDKGAGAIMKVEIEKK